MANRIKIVSKDKQGNDKTVYVVKPGTKESANSKIAANKAFKTAIDSGCYFKSKLDQIMRDQGLWDDSKQAKLEELNQKVANNVKKLKRGGLELDEAKEVALQIRRDRAESFIMLAKTLELDAFSVEGQAENAAFDYIVSVCTVDEEGKKIFSSYEDYQEQADEPFAREAASQLGQLVRDYDADWEKKLPENEFLLKYKFCNDDLGLINEEGKLVSVKGRIIDEKGRYRTEDGGYEDIDGNKMDADGNYLDAKPFTKNGVVV